MMKVAFGLKPHSGWAALVVLGSQADDLQVLDRRRIDLVETRDAGWAKQPYHAAEGKSQAEARRIVERGIESARRIAIRELRSAIHRMTEKGTKVSACAVLSTDPMPDWSVEEILAVHFRMHKAEGVLFRDALARAAAECSVKLVAIPEKTLAAFAQKALATPSAKLFDTVSRLGKSVGAPWGKDQKEAALAAMIALHPSTLAQGAPSSVEGH
jgi:hypothetical protein